LRLGVLVCLLAAAAQATAEQRLAFIGVALDRETREADAELQDYLYREAGVSFAPEDLEYGRVIERLANWKESEGLYVARATPYVYVAAEMLGADFEILATYVSSATQRTTYHSYFVVNREDFPAQPELTDIIRFLGRRSDRAEFVYHSKFSTSSFFLPSLYFRAHKIFHMRDSTPSLTAISSRRIDENSSSALVRKVAAGEADLAAVWTGTRSKFEPGHPSGGYEEYGRRVHFVELPTTLPNDLLVCSTALDPEIKENLRSAIESMEADEIDIGDFRTWSSFKQATEARLALAELRWSARERVAPVTVEIRLADGHHGNAAASPLLEAGRQAVRLSGTEFVLYDQDFHKHIDFVWKLEEIHDGAVALHSTIPGSDVDEQVFRISFRDTEDLTRRIVSLIHSRMHRIRYAWPYSDNPPIVIRDMAFSIPVGSVAKVQRISWLDPERNDFRAGPLFDAAITSSEFYKYVLDGDDFPKPGSDELEFDAMSNVSFRVLLLRASQERTVFRVLTVVLLGLVLAAAVAAVLGLRRSAAGDPMTLATPRP
jgi:ABC-type phosphate/phosphonate transport system substrate-binding protein